MLALFAPLALISMIIAPFLFLSIIRKMLRNQTSSLPACPTEFEETDDKDDKKSSSLLVFLVEKCLLECALLIVGAVSVWLFILSLFTGG